MVITLPSNQWVDIYATTGKHRHLKLKVQNQNNSILYASSESTQPLVTDIGEVVPALDYSETYVENLWVKSVDEASTIAIIEDITANSSTVDDSTVRFVEQRSVSATVISAGSLVGGVVLGKTDSTRINLLDGDIVLRINPGETITLAAKKYKHYSRRFILTVDRRDLIIRLFPFALLKFKRFAFSPWLCHA